MSGVAEGAALGAAFLGRMAAGLESSVSDAARWASVDRIVDPDPAWSAAVEDRYGRFLELAKGPGIDTASRAYFGRHGGLNAESTMAAKGPGEPLGLDRGQVAHVCEEAHRAVLGEFEPVGGVRVPHRLGGDIPTVRREVVDDVIALVAIDQL